MSRKGTSITIKDMANRLNVSVSTVSRALRGVEDINAETKKRVLDLAESLDYQPNLLAQSLVKSRTKTLGVIVPSIGYGFFSSVLQGIESEASKAGYSLLLCQSSERFEKEKANIQNLLRSQVDGFIISLSNDTNKYDHIERLLQREIPLVVFDRYSNDLACSKVVIDNRGASKEAVSHLIANGNRNILMLAGPEHLHLTQERIAGYKEALAEAGITFDPLKVAYCDFTLKDASEHIEALWKIQTTKPDAIFAVSDRIAMTAIFTLKKMGVFVPNDVAVIGFNDDPFSSMFTPPLSSVTQPTFEIGEQVVKLLIEQINRPEDEQIQYKTKLLSTKLVIRESSVRPT